MVRFYVYGFPYSTLKNYELSLLLLSNNIISSGKNKATMMDQLRLLELGDNGIIIPEVMYTTLFLNKKIEDPETGEYVIVRDIKKDLPKVLDLCGEDNPCEITGIMDIYGEMKEYRFDKPLPVTKTPQYFESEITRASPVRYGVKEEERSVEEEPSSEDEEFIVSDESIEEEPSEEPTEEYSEEESEEVSKEPVRGRILARPKPKPVQRARSRSPVESDSDSELLRKLW